MRYLEINKLKSFLNVLKLNKNNNTLKINNLSLDQEKFDIICKFIENNKYINTFNLKQNIKHLLLKKDINKYYIVLKINLLMIIMIILQN